MTTFEIIVAVGIIVIVGLKILEFTGMATTYVKMKEGFECLAKKVEWCDDKLDLIKFAALDISNQLNNIEDNILDVCKQQQGALACDVTTIVKGVNELTDIVDKMHRNLCVEIADKMVDRVYPPTHDTPCYAPDNTRNTIKVKGKRCELTDEQKSEILYRLTHPVVESPFKPPFNPTCETTNKED